MLLFADRVEAGRKLAERLMHLKDRDPVVYALPRGGLPLGAEVAIALDAPLDILLVRKIGAPMQPELAVGAVVDGADPIVIRHKDIIQTLGLSDKEIDEGIEKQLKEIERRRRLYAGHRERLDPKGRTAIVVDDGIATGSTMEAGVEALRRGGAARIFLAVPVAPPDAIERFKGLVDEIICLDTPKMFFAVGAHYRHFGQLTDDDVIRLLDEAHARRQIAQAGALSSE